MSKNITNNTFNETDPIGSTQYLKDYLKDYFSYRSQNTAQTNPIVAELKQNYIDAIYLGDPNPQEIIIAVPGQPMTGDYLVPFFERLGEQLATPEKNYGFVLYSPSSSGSFTFKAQARELHRVLEVIHEIHPSVESYHLMGHSAGSTIVGEYAEVYSDEMTQEVFPIRTITAIALTHGAGFERYPIDYYVPEKNVPENITGFLPKTFAGLAEYYFSSDTWKDEDARKSVYEWINTYPYNRRGFLPAYGNYNKLKKMDPQEVVGYDIWGLNPACRLFVVAGLDDQNNSPLHAFQGLEAFIGKDLEDPDYTNTLTKNYNDAQGKNRATWYQSANVGHLAMMEDENLPLEYFNFLTNEQSE